MSRVLLTRSEEDNRRLGSRLQQLGMKACSLPLLQIEPLEETPQ